MQMRRFELAVCLTPRYFGFGNPVSKRFQNSRCGRSYTRRSPVRCQYQKSLGAGINYQHSVAASSHQQCQKLSKRDKGRPDCIYVNPMKRKVGSTMNRDVKVQPMDIEGRKKLN